MKKSFFTLLFIASTLQFGFAQIAIDTLVPAKLDSIFPYQDHLPTCGDNDTLLLDPNGGYVTGNNSKGDLEKIQKFKAGKIGQITEILVHFNTSVGANDTVYGVIYDINPLTGGPGSVTGRTNPRLVSEIEYDIQFGFETSFVFDPSFPVDDSFFVGFTLPTVTDTVACSSTEDACFSVEVWEKRANGSFHPLNEEWNKNIDLWVFPVLSESNIGSTGKNMKGLSLNNVYPNPASGNAAIAYNIDNASAVTIKLFDVLGRTVVTKQLGKQTSGKHAEVIDLQGMSSGNYFYQIVTESAALCGKIIVE